MTINEFIDAAIARGEFKRAAHYACELLNPAAHLAAMTRIFNASKGRPMLQLTKQSAKLVNWNPKPELHGQDPQPAGDVTFEFNAASEDVLPMFSPMLRGLLFHRNGAVQHDLADETAHAPDLRFPNMPGPFAWSMQLEAATLTIHIDDREETAIALNAAVKRPVNITPMQGGTVVVTLQARCHPDAEQAGKIYMLMGKTLAISFAPGDETEEDDENFGDA